MRFASVAGAIAMVTWASLAAAEPGEVRAQKAADAAAITARKLRHLWDTARASQPSAATCVEDKVARATTLAVRVERRRLELREATDDKARAVALAAIDALDAQRLELEDEANVCVHGRPIVFPAAGTKVTVTPPSSLPKDAERELLMMLLGMPMLGR